MSAFWFTIRFCGYSLVLMAAMRVDELVWSGALNASLCRHAARTVATILRIFSADARADGAFVHYGGTVVGIVPECIGIEMIGFFLVAVLAFPAPWPSRLRIIALGVPSLLVANGIRLTTLVYAAPQWPRMFDVAHLYVWPLLIHVTAITLFMQWVRGHTVVRR